jgi:hypothetical protein
MFTRSDWRRVATLLAGAASLRLAGNAGAQADPRPSYRHRLLGVYSAQSGDPVEGAEVIDMLGKVTARTTPTGTVTLAYLPEGETLLRIRKVGFEVTTMLVSITPEDTVPVTVLLKPAVQTLPTVFTTDSSVSTRISPGLREFEMRRARGNGVFVTEAELRKNDTKYMTSIARTISGVKVVCSRSGSSCVATSGRQNGRFALGGGGCPVDVYIDGIVSTENNLERLRVDQFAAVEFYAGGARTPVQYNKTGSSCGVLLLWTREQ